MPFNPNGSSVIEEDEAPRLVPEDTIFRATVQELKPRTARFTDRRTGEPREIEFVQWYFEIADGDYEGRVVRGEAEYVQARNSKLMQWAAAELRAEFVPGGNVDWSQIPGQVVEITVRHRPDKNDPDKKWVEVDEVMAPEGSFDFDKVPF
jgi:hypothetical protein